MDYGIGEGSRRKSRSMRRRRSRSRRKWRRPRNKSLETPKAVPIEDA
jgi:hypothetical protein